MNIQFVFLILTIFIFLIGSAFFITDYLSIPDEVAEKAKNICSQNGYGINGVTRSISIKNTWYANCDDRSAIDYVFEYDVESEESK